MKNFARNAVCGLTGSWGLAMLPSARRYEMLDTSAIARDLDLCDMIDVFGSRGSKKKATAQRKAIFNAIKAQNAKDFPTQMNDEELMAELGV